METAQVRIRQLEQQVAQIRKTATDRENYRLSAAGFLAEIDRMNLEIRDYFSSFADERASLRRDFLPQRLQPSPCEFSSPEQIKNGVTVRAPMLAKLAES